MNSRTKKFLSYYKPYLGLLIADLLCALVVTAITLTIPLCTRYITKNILDTGLADATARILQVGLFMLVLAVVHTACNIFVGYRGHAMGAMMESDMRAELFGHLQKLPYRFYDEQKTGQLMSRLTNDLLSLTELYHHGPEDIVIYFVRFVGAFAILMTINVKLTLAVFAFLPFMAVFVLIYNKRMRAAMRRNKRRIADVNARVEDSLAGIRVVQSFGNEDMEQEKFEKENDRFLDSRIKSYREESYCYDGAGGFIQLITVAVVVFGGISIVQATLDLADLITFLLYVGYITEPIHKLIHITNQYQEGFTSFERFMEIMEIEPEIRDAPDARDLQIKGDVEFRNVGFRYREDTGYILRGVSLRAAPGEYVALVGSSGVGKTTLCSLIPRFYDVGEGSLLVDGVDVRNIKLHSLRKSVGVVQQDVYLFAGTVLENIRYGRPEATDEEIVEAAKQANAHEFITGLPEGYHTDIGQRGVKLSGGQRQRLSIARVFLKNPPILILDEATSALDSESERVVQESFERLAHGRTTFVIAHRLSTIRNASRILVLSDRGIDEQGSHDELLAMEGAYANLYQMQYQGL